MANFRRRRPRGRSFNAIRGSQASWRAKYGFRPPRITREMWAYPWDTWSDLWKPYPSANRGKKISAPYQMMNSVPAWWVRSFLVKPHRAACKTLTRNIKIGRFDTEDTCYPLDKKAQGYYW